MQFQLTDDFIENIEQLIAKKDGNELRELLHELHFADIAELLEELSSDEATYLVKLLESELTSEALMELDDDVREKILDRLSPKEIAKELAEMDTDDAADIIAELDDDIQQKVINKLEDDEHAADIIELLKYDEDTAGGLMAKELVQVKETWTVAGCVREMRRQAENVTRVHSIYVTDKEGKFFNYIKGNKTILDIPLQTSNWDSKQFSSQGIGNVATLGGDLEITVAVMDAYIVKTIVEWVGDTYECVQT